MGILLCGEQNRKNAKVLLELATELMAIFDYHLLQIMQTDDKYDGSVIISNPGVSDRNMSIFVHHKHRQKSCMTCTYNSKVTYRLIPKVRAEEIATYVRRLEARM